MALGLPPVGLIGGCAFCQPRHGDTKRADVTRELGPGLASESDVYRPETLCDALGLVLVGKDQKDRRSAGCRPRPRWRWRAGRPGRRPGPGSGQVAAGERRAADADDQDDGADGELRGIEQVDLFRLDQRHALQADDAEQEDGQAAGHGRGQRLARRRPACRQSPAAWR